MQKRPHGISANISSCLLSRARWGFWQAGGKQVQLLSDYRVASFSSLRIKREENVDGVKEQRDVEEQNRCVTK